MWDALVIGAGPNGLAAAVTLAKQGCSVLVLEEQARPGGAVYSTQSTLPGYWHDVGAAFFPFASTSPAFRALDLEGAGLEWRHGRRDSCHPAPDGSCATVSRDLELSKSSFGRGRACVGKTEQLAACAAGSLYRNFAVDSLGFGARHAIGAQRALAARPGGAFLDCRILVPAFSD